jgi:hypothetical protein
VNAAIILSCCRIIAAYQPVAGRPGEGQVPRCNRLLLYS